MSYIPTLPYIGDPAPQPSWQGPWWGIFPPTQNTFVWPSASNQTPSQLQQDGSVLVDGHRYRYDGGYWVLVTKE